MFVKLKGVSLLNLKTVPALVAASALLTAGCSSAPHEEKALVLGDAWAGPTTLILHKDIDFKSPAVTTASHGDKLEIIGQRRRSWYKVRDSRGREGWVGTRELLDAAQMKRLLTLAEQSANLPSQGKATTFSEMNVHIEPSRQATSFIQVKPKEQFEIIAHSVAVRTPAPVRQLIPPKPKVEKKSTKKGKGEKDSKADIPPPPAPRPPGPPDDWLQLSRAGAPGPETLPVQAPPQAAPPVPKDDWTLIRTSTGQSGWVLTSSIYLEIPDDVAQHADGHRITSYFSIGKTVDPAGDKDIWLWTTSEKLGAGYDFDGYRVFSWSRRHQRYETSYIQRHEHGYFPVIAARGEFSVCLEKNDGTLARKQFRMSDTSVRPAGEKPCEKPPVYDLPADSRPDGDESPVQAAAEGLAKQRQAVQGLMDKARGWWTARIAKKEQK